MRQENLDNQMEEVVLKYCLPSHVSESATLETCILCFSLLSLQPVERAPRLISPKRLFKPLLILY